MNLIQRYRPGAGGAGPSARRLLAVVVCSFALLLSGVLFPGAANAVGCTRKACNGKNPASMGCDADARTIKSFTGSWDLHVELRYSPKCVAAWARGTLPKGAPSSVNYQVGIVAYDCSAASADCRLGYHAFYLQPGKSRYSLMWNTYSDWVKACANYHEGHPFIPPDSCTGAY
jgi:hypothetical protein